VRFDYRKRWASQNPGSKERRELSIGFDPSFENSSGFGVIFLEFIGDKKSYQTKILTMCKSIVF
jgi:hypothetical protein